MAISKNFMVFVGFNLIFLVSAGLHLFIPLYTRAANDKPATLSTIANQLLLDRCPLTVSMVNSGIMILSFLISLPALFMQRNQILLQIHAWTIVLSAVLTLAIGLEIWFSTLQTRANLAPLWASQPTFTQSMLQFKFKCCGYDNPTVFVEDGTCPNVADAARHGGCEGPFSVYANQFLDIVFTTFFGFVAVDMLVLLSVLCVIKERKETARYAFIEEKSLFAKF